MHPFQGADARLRHVIFGEQKEVPYHLPETIQGEISIDRKAWLNDSYANNTGATHAKEPALKTRISKRDYKGREIKEDRGKGRVFKTVDLSEEHESELKSLYSTPTIDRDLDARPQKQHITNTPPRLEYQPGGSLRGDDNDFADVGSFTISTPVSPGIPSCSYQLTSPLMQSEAPPLDQEVSLGGAL